MPRKMRPNVLWISVLTNTHKIFEGYIREEAMGTKGS